MLKKPERPYKNTRDAAKKIGWDYQYGKEDRIKSDDYFPCNICSGLGKLIDPNEIPDVVEGYKFAKRISCQNCFGTGEIGKKRFREIYKFEIEKYRSDLKTFKHKEATIKQILSPLSKGDIAILKEYFSTW
jgi:hypothetical protein